jgi:hypothetical protein
MNLAAFRPNVKNSLRGFATVTLPNDLTIFGCLVHVANGRAWASLPGKAAIDRDGRQIVSDGKAQYATVLKWGRRDLANRFSDAVIELVRQQHPDALDDGSAP